MNHYCTSCHLSAMWIIIVLSLCLNPFIFTRLDRNDLKTFKFSRRAQSRCRPCRFKCDVSNVTLQRYVGNVTLETWRWKHHIRNVSLPTWCWKRDVENVTFETWRCKRDVGNVSLETLRWKRDHGCHGGNVTLPTWCWKRHVSSVENVALET